MITCSHCKLLFFFNARLRLIKTLRISIFLLVFFFLIWFLIFFSFLSVFLVLLFVTVISIIFMRHHISWLCWILAPFNNFPFTIYFMKLFVFLGCRTRYVFVNFRKFQRNLILFSSFYSWLMMRLSRWKRMIFATCFRWNFYLFKFIFIFSFIHFIKPFSFQRKCRSIKFLVFLFYFTKWTFNFLKFTFQKIQLFVPFFHCISAFTSFKLLFWYIIFFKDSLLFYTVKINQHLLFSFFFIYVSSLFYKIT